MYGILQEGKHQFLIDLSRNVLRGKIQAARNGKGSSLPPYGYDRAYYDQTGEMVKRVPYGQKFRKPEGWAMRFVLSDDGTAVETVRWIFDTFAHTDAGMTWIAGDLNRRGVRSPQGKAWSVQTIQGILRKRTYIGANVFGDARYGKYHHLGGRGEITKGRGLPEGTEPIVVDGVHDVLIKRELFDRCQRKLDDRALSGQRPRHNRYLLSGVLRCGHCGGTLAGKGYHKGNVPRYYACVTGQTRPGACKRYQIQQAPIEDYILGVIEERLLSDEAVDQIIRQIHDKAKAKPSFKGQAKALRAQIDALDRKITRGTENLLLASPDHMDELSAMLTEWKDERAQLQVKLETIARNPDGRSADDRAQRAVAELRRLKEHLQTGDPMRVRAVVKSLVEEIRLWWEPYGKRNKRFVRGVLTFKGDLEVFSQGTHAR